jgi:pSer/pThr/pTyr-binding forkhead associated (FHA) protein
MPQSTKCTLTELIARFKGSQVEGIKQKYPLQTHFLLVPSNNNTQPSLAWTPHRSETRKVPAITRQFELEKEETAESEKTPYLTPKTIVVPIFKTIRNNSAKIIAGRASNCDIRFTSDKITSRHALLTINNVELWVADNNSTNGTFINGQRLKTGEYYRVYPTNEISFADIRTMYADLDFLVELIKMQE